MKNAVLLLLFLLFVSNSFSQEKSHRIDRENSKCLENAVPTTMGSIQCEQQALDAWKIELKKVITKIKSKPQLLDVALFQEMQTAWETFHKSSVSFYHSYYQKHYQGGTLARVAAITYEKRNVRKRVLYLLDFFDNLEEE